MNEGLAARDNLAVRLDNIGDVILPGSALHAVKEISIDTGSNPLLMGGGSR
jgi:hypothetical protein